MQQQSWDRARQRWRKIRPRGLRVESLEPRTMLAGDVVITELMADNLLTLRDWDDDSSDWVEIQNRGAAPVDLAGWYLTDDPGDLAKWPFPAGVPGETVLDVGQYTVVYLSGKDKIAPDPGGSAQTNGAQFRLHADFSLNDSGEYLALVRPNGTIESEIDTSGVGEDPGFGPQFKDVSFGLAVPPPVIVDNLDPEFSTTGTWKESKAVDEHAGSSLQADEPGVTATWTPVLNQAGLYNVHAWWSGSNASGAQFDRDSAAEFTIQHNGLSEQLVIDQDDGNGTWVPLGTYEFDAAGGEFVKVSRTSDDGLTAADAVRFTPVGLNAGTDELVYMDNPTPGGANAAGQPAVAAKPMYSATTGTYTANFSLTLTSDIPGASIYYTTNGAVPQAIASQLYSGPINVSTTTQVRAFVRADGHVDSRFEAETFYRVDANLQNFSSNLPVIVVDTFFQFIDGGTPRVGYMAMYEPDGDTGMTSFAAAPDDDSRMQIKWRGSSTQNEAKHPYSMELIKDGSNLDRDLSLAGMPSESDWVLQGPYHWDRSLTRNSFIFEVSRQAGRYATRTQLVEMFVNENGGTLSYAGDYVGVYVLIEKIKRGQDRVDIGDELSPNYVYNPDFNAPTLEELMTGEITGGYMFKDDRIDPGDSGFGIGNADFGYVYPKEIDIRTPAWDNAERYLRDYLTAFRAAASSFNFIHPTYNVHYSEFIDVQSFVDHHILNELALNVDAFRLSSYYKKPRDGKLEAEPIWDFDRSMESTDGRDDSPQQWYNERFWTWWADLFRDPDFRQAWTDRWTEWREDVFSIENLQQIHGVYAAQLQPNPNDPTDSPQERNFNRWTQYRPRFGGTGLNGTFMGEIAHMDQWLETRINWIDGKFLATPTLSDPPGEVDEGFSFTMTAPAGATIYYTTDGTDPRLPGGLISETAIQYAGGPVTIDQNTMITARSYNPSFNSDFYFTNEPWSGLEEAIFTTDKPTLTISEINYNPQDPTPDEQSLGFTDQDDFEYLELFNYGSEPVRLADVSFSNGVTFDFATDATAASAPVIVDNLDPEFSTTGTWSESKAVDEHEGSSLQSNEPGVTATWTPALTQAGLYEVHAWWSGSNAAGAQFDRDSAAEFTIDHNGLSELLIIDQDDGNGTWVPLGTYEFDAAGGEFVKVERTSGDGLTAADAVRFTPVQFLQPGQYALVVRNLAAFQSRYDTTGMYVAGEFVDSGLSNSGERVTLTDRFDQRLATGDYDDDWYGITDGGGFSLTRNDPFDTFANLDSRSSWRPSALVDGTPGAADTGLPLGSVIINEVLSHTDQSATGDWIELLNTTDDPIDLGGWYLSDSSDLQKYRIPDGTVIDPRAYLVLDQLVPGGFGDDPLARPAAFGLSESGDNVRLVSVDPNRVREDIDAVHVVEDGGGNVTGIILSTASDAMLGADFFGFGNGDLVFYDPATGIASLFLPETIFAPDPLKTKPNENIDAVHVRSGGNVVLSTASDARIGALSFTDGDLVEYTPGGGAVLLMSESVFSIDTDVDAVYVEEDGAGNLLSVILSVSGDVAINSTLFDDGDLIRLRPLTPTALATADLSNIVVTRYLSESLFSIEGTNLEPTENVDAFSLRGGGNLVLSTGSRATIDGLGFQFEDADLVDLDPGASHDLANGTLGAGAGASLLFEEDPLDGSVTFYGEPAGYRADADFAAAEREVTFGVYTKSTGNTDFVALVAPTRGGPNAAPVVGPVVIHEIMYAPADGGLEYIELKNITGQPVTLFDPANPDNAWALTSGVEFTFPAGVTLQPGELALVVPTDAATFRANVPVPAETQVFGPYTGALDNAGDDPVELSRPGAPEPDLSVPMILVDRVKYQPAAPWPVLNPAGGESLQRIDPAGYGNDAVNWTSNAGFGTPGTVPPQVVEVLVAGSRWSPAFLDYLHQAGLGSGGFAIGSGADQLVTVPWTGVDQIKIRFSQDMIVSADHLSLTGVNTAQFDVASFNYDPADFVATWTLTGAIRSDKLQLDLRSLSQTAGGVSSATLVPLDGNFQNVVDTLPTGNGLVEAADHFSFRLNVLPGDARPGDEAVSRTDVLDVVLRLGHSTASPGYNPRLDGNADGQINIADLRDVLFRFPTTLPIADPAPGIAADTVFTELGTTPSTPLAATSPADTTRATREASPRRIRPTNTGNSPASPAAADTPTLRRDFAGPRPLRDREPK